MMGCPRCGVSNQQGAGRCGGCGARLAHLEPLPVSREPVTCPACGTVSPWDALYCASCGKLLVTPPSQTEAATVAPPQAAVAVEHMGFWIRLVAAIVDGIITAVIQGVVVSAPFHAAGLEGDGGAWFGLMYLIGMVAGWAYHVLFIGLKGATPGKMLLGMKVVDRSGHQPSIGMAFVREVPGKIVSGIVLGLGYIWVAFDGRKQGWHDKMAGTYVVRSRREG